MTLRYALFLIIASLAASGCRDNGIDGGGTYSPALKGSVTGVLGNPIPGVGVHYIFSLSPTTHLAPLKKPLPPTTIEFNLPADRTITLRILRYGTRELLVTLVDHQPMAAGVHSVDFDATPFTTCLYIYQLLVEGLPAEERVMALLK